MRLLSPVLTGCAVIVVVPLPVVVVGVPGVDGFTGVAVIVGFSGSGVGSVLASVQVLGSVPAP